MSTGKTVMLMAACVFAAGVVVVVMRQARKGAAARRTAGFTADSAPPVPASTRLSIDVDTGEPVLKAE